MHISINTAEDLSGVDKNILRALVGEVVPAKASAAAPSVTKAAKKTAAAKPEPEPEVVEEDLVGGDEPTLEDAVALATSMVADGKAKEVKAALNEVGAAKVSALKGDQIAKFLAELA